MNVGKRRGRVLPVEVAETRESDSTFHNLNNLALCSQKGLRILFRHRVDNFYEPAKTALVIMQENHQK